MELFVKRPIDTYKAAKILEIVSKYFSLSVEDIKGTRKKDKLIRARFISYWLLYSYAGSNYMGIGKYLGKNHAAVLKGIRKVDFAINTKTWLHQEATELEAKVKSWLCHPFHQQNANLPNYTMKSLLEQKLNKHIAA